MKTIYPLIDIHQRTRELKNLALNKILDNQYSLFGKYKNSEKG